MKRKIMLEKRNQRGNERAALKTAPTLESLVVPVAVDPISEKSDADIGAELAGELSRGN